MSSENAEAAEWYYARNNQQQGPYPISTLQEWARTGLLSRTDWIWRTGWENWKVAAEVPELFAPGPTSSSAPPPPIGGSSSAPMAEGSDSTANYFTRHWRGDLSLPISFWINNVLLNIVVSVVTSIIVGVLAILTQSSPSAALLLSAVVIAVFGAIGVWQLVGLWRSASKHTARGGHAFWAILVKILVVIWLALVLLSILGAFIGIGSNLSTMGR